MSTPEWSPASPAPLCSGGASHCHWLPAASGNSHSLVKQPNSPGLPDELLPAGSCPGQVGTPGSCCCWKGLAEKPSGCEAGGGGCGSPGNCPQVTAAPQGAGGQPRGPAQPWPCQPSPESRLAWSWFVNPWQCCPAQLLCDVGPLDNSSALHT